MNEPRELSWFDHEGTDEIICPHCGYEFTDSWECDGNSESFEVDCGECGLEFDVERNISVTYTTSRKDGAE